MNRYWNPLLNELQPYVPGEQPQNKQYIKLNTNENPYPPSPLAIEAINKTVNERLRLYPDPECHKLRNAIAKYHSILPAQVFVGNGSDEVLAFAYLSFFNPEKPILFPDITYSFYPVYANLFRNRYELIPLNEDFTLPVEAFLQENGGIIFPNPNAPTGVFLPCKNVEMIVKYNSNSIVILDEAYIAFGGESADKLIDKYPNLLIIRTLSKSHSLAGLRVGYAIGDKGLIEGLNRVKNSINSYTLDRLALAGAEAAMLDKAYLEETTKKIINTRERVSMYLIKQGFTVIPSKANFIFISHPRLSANVIYQLLRERGILVRYFNKTRMNNYLRVTIGTDHEMDDFLRTINKMVNSYSNDN